MRLLRNVLVPLLAASLIALTGCGNPRVVVKSREPGEPVHSVSNHPDALALLDRRWIKTRRDQFRLLAFLSAVGQAKEQPPSVELSSSVTPTSLVTEAAAAPSYPYPVSSMRCPAGPVQDEIRAVFGGASDWAESIAWRESNCQPGARNGSSGSAGVFQLLGHDDLLSGACPSLDPATSWADADCNIRAAFNLYVGSGIAPWRL